MHTHFILCVCEDHTKSAPADIVTTLAVINARNKTVSTVVSGADFYASPAFSPDGTHVAWQQWNHPDMPWDGSEIYVASVAAEESRLQLADIIHVAGKHGNVSAGYPVWASSNVLLFTCDISGYQNPWTYTLSTKRTQPVLESPVPEDFSLPMWALGWSFGALLDTDGHMALYTAMRNGRSVLYILSLQSGALEEVECPYVEIQHVRRVTDDAVVFLGTKADAPEVIVLCTIKDYSKPKFSTLQPAVGASRDRSFGPEFFSRPRPITLEVPETKEPIHIVYFPPTNPHFFGPEGVKPPCIVDVHGGPTGNATQALNLTAQYFTSRGWAWSVSFYVYILDS
jgi:dipeptidyl aminopeptidase/acylaminoacyl peptidase